MFCFVSIANIWQKFRIFATSCKNPKNLLFFFTFSMSIQKVCRVCNKFLKDTKRSNALYCGKRCKNKAVTLRKHINPLNEPKTAKTIDIDHPLHGAPNIYDTMTRLYGLQTQLAWHQKHAQHIREIDDMNAKIRKLESEKQMQKDIAMEKLGNSLLFGFTSIINQAKQNIKPHSGFMPISSDDLDELP